MREENDLGFGRMNYWCVPVLALSFSLHYLIPTSSNDFYTCIVPTCKMLSLVCVLHMVLGGAEQHYYSD